MDDTNQPINPYASAQQDFLMPFAGRVPALSRFHQHIVNPTKTHPVIFIGRQHIGKTALLQYISALPDAHYIPVYIPLRRMNLQSEAIWLKRLSRQVMHTVESYGFLLNEIVPPPDDGDAIRVWFADTCLGAVFLALRQSKRLVLLFDDIEALQAPIQAGTIPKDVFEYLYHLLQPQLGIACTLSLEAENHLAFFHPLVHTDGLYRLQNLTKVETVDLIRRPVEGVYTLDDAALTTIFEATGGDPTCLQQFGYHLYEFALKKGITHVTQAHIRAVMPTVYQNCSDEFQRIWKTSNRDEQLVLTALASLRYDFPTEAVDTATIEQWMVETDYLMDATAINAAIRSLDYRDILQADSANVVIRAGLMQKWLLEHALLGIETYPSRSATGAVRRSWVVVALIVFLILAVVLVINLNGPQGTTNESSASPVPTVTLSGDDD